MTIRSLWADADLPHDYAFDQDRILIGRSAGADVCIPHKAVSLSHAVIAAVHSHYTIEDQESTNGTKVNDEALPPRRPKRLQTGDRIECGGFELTFSAGVPVSVPTTEIGTASIARHLVEAALGNGPTDRPLPELHVVAGPDRGKVLTLPGPPARLTVGRAEDCDLFLTDPDVSRHHIEINVDVDGYEAYDLRSKNGLWVAGKPVERRRLRHRDTFQLAGTVLRFEDPVDTVVRALMAAPDEKVAVPTRTRPAATGPAAAELGGGRSANGDLLAGSDVATGASGLGFESVMPDRNFATAALATAAPEAGRRARRTPTRKNLRYGFDLVIYVLAGAVLALSIAGLVALLRP